MYWNLSVLQNGAHFFALGV